MQISLPYSSHTWQYTLEFWNEIGSGCIVRAQSQWEAYRLGSIIESIRHLPISIRNDVRFLCEPSNRRGTRVYYIGIGAGAAKEDSVSKLVRIPTEVWEVVNSCLYWLVALSETQRFRSLAQTEFLAVVRLTAFMMLLSQAMLASSM